MIAEVVEKETAGRKQIAHPSFAEAFRFWVKLGLISLGGPTGQIAIMQPSRRRSGSANRVPAEYRNIPRIAAPFYGLKPAVMAIVAAAVMALKNSVMRSRCRARER